MGQTSTKVRATKSRRNFLATNAPDSPHWTLNSSFGAFCTIWMYLGQFDRLTKLGAKWAELVQKVRFQEVVSKFFATNTPDPPHCILN